VNHAWCHDVSRDAAVRAAEDGRTGPLPTLGECISGVTETMSEKARGEGMLHGLRTERVTLDITIREDDTELFQGYDTLAHGVASYIRGELRRGLGESVRVVSDEEIDALGVAEPFLREIEDMRAAGTVLNGLVVELTAERDAAIRERESWKILADRANDDRDKLQARVAELEAASGGGGSSIGSELVRRLGRFTADLQSGAVDMPRGKPKAASGGNSSAILTSSQDASGGGEGEPVAWGVRMKSGTFKGFLFPSSEQANKCAELITDDVVAFFEAPPQPRGWLTEEEREVISSFVNGPYVAARHAGVLSRLLARSTPPEVVLPLADLGDRLLRDGVIDALAAAGVAVKEVPE